MITIDSLAERIEQGLNASASAYKFKFRIFVDASKFARARKTRTEKELYINSLLRVGESEIVPTQGITVATQAAMLEVCVPIFNEEQIEDVSKLFRSMLDGYFAMYKVQSIDGYTVSSTYSLATTGTLESRGNVGPSLTFYVNMQFAYIEGGLNSSNCTFKLDGITIPYTTAAIGKRAVTEDNSYADTDGQSLGVNSAFVRSFDFQIPAQISGVSAIILSELLDKDLGTVHTLTVTTESKVNTYAVIVVSTDLNVQGIDNAGHTLSLVEARNGTTLI